jgi:hypothetical protein
MKKLSLLAFAALLLLVVGSVGRFVYADEKIAGNETTNETVTTKDESGDVNKDESGSVTDDQNHDTAETGEVNEAE